ncbi:Histidine phosphatase superfamily, clade-1 [Corchorus capsularis]|uniref:Histidine phosphatase superfamily, clade-1 n=1 Tax=Corchorus capsularis TaxID=210143 RepID=A0A1R3FYK0_COCAP|nr:Histidine phosphatase superfamily, clade-1 [Corchorus capsularis]
MAAPPSLYLGGSRHKLLHMVRHAQGVHNLESDKSRDPVTSSKFFDAQLSSLGWEQVRDQRKTVCENGLFQRIELVITSPLSRTLQTAVGIFHGEEVIADESGKVDVKKDETLTFNNRPPIIVNERCRERLGKYECDKRQSISQYRSRFPAVDFSLIEDEDDILWTADEREPRDEVIARGMDFMKWLWGRKEKEIALVSHGVFLQELMIELINSKKCLPLNMEGDIPRSRFKNCEIRSMIISYDSVMGLVSDSFAINNINHCGRIQYGFELLQRDSAKENVSVEDQVTSTNGFPDSTLTVRS